MDEAWIDARDDDQDADVVEAVDRAPAEAVLVFDGLGDILQANDAAERLFGQTSPSLIGGGIGRVLTVGQSGGWPVADRVGGFAGHAASVTLVGHRGGGETFPAELVVVASGTCDRYVGVVRDLTHPGYPGHSVQPDHAIGQAEGGGFRIPSGPTPILLPQPDRLALPAPAIRGGQRLLVCEPDPSAATLLATLLEEVGFRVDLARDAGQVRRLLGGAAYAALIIDLRLPNQEGLGLVRALRLCPETRDMPVIVVSGRPESGGRSWQPHHDLTGAAFGIVDWIQQPADDGRLAEVVRHVAGSGRGRQRILHVEDDRTSIRAVAAQVGDIAAVEAVTTLGEARLRLASEPFDLVILDLRLHDGSGFELLEDINTLVPPVPVLLVSTLETVPAGAQVRSHPTNGDLVSAIRALVAGSPVPVPSPKRLTTPGPRLKPPQATGRERRESGGVTGGR